MCEVFPKIAACRYHRYGMGGGVEDRHSICILGLNMINDKVFVILWFWHCFIVFIGSIRIITRTSQVTSSKIRYFLLRTRLKRYLKNNAHTQHIQHYVTHCSIGKINFNFTKKIKNNNIIIFVIKCLKKLGPINVKV